MLYSSALVLGTLALGVAAHPNRHASFHERRKADSKRDLKDVDWKHIAYDLSDVNWSTVFPKLPAATPQAAAPVAIANVPVITPSPAVPASPAASASSASPAVPVSPTPPVNANTDTVKTESVGSLSGDLLAGFTNVAVKIGNVVGTNARAGNGGIWIGSDSVWKGNFINGGNAKMILYCWRANGYSGMSIKANQPDIAVGLDAGKSITLSFAQGVPGACSVATSDTTLAMSGAIDNTWWEFNFGPNEKGAFDVSKNTNMRGIAINSVGSKCTSNMDQCVFQCNDPSLPSCWTAGSYKLTNCGSAQGGGTGFDPVMGGDGGGCQMGATGETVNVTFG